MKLLAIDGNSILNRAFFGVHPLTTKDGIHTNAIFGFLNIMFKLEREIAPTAVAIAFDVSRKTFRNDFYDQYKANRKGMPEELREQLPLIKEILTLMGYKIIGCDGYEGDDILGTLSKMCTQNNDECVVASGDRDCLQLVNDKVNVLLVKTKENILYDNAGVLRDFGITPMQVIELKALMGDSSDNIPGVKGVGEKTALTLIQKYQGIDTIYADVDAIESTARVKKLLTDDKDNAYMSHKLATICCDAPIDVALDDCFKKEAQIEELSKLMTRLEMFSFFQKLNLTSTKENLQKDDSQTEKVSVTIIKNATDEQLENALQKEKEINIIQRNGELFININDTVYCVPETQIDDIINFVAKNKIPIRTYMAKILIKRIKLLGYTDVNLIFDLELAAYLLSPSAKGYDLQTLRNRYLSDISFDVSDEYIDIASLPRLCEAAKAALEAEGMTTLYYEIELPLCEVLCDMEIEGFAIDVAGVEEFGKKLDQMLSQVTARIYELAGEEFNINSTKELANILFEKLGLPAKKKTKTGYSTNVDVLESLLNSHEIIPEIIEYRKLSKLQSTYVLGLLKVVAEDKRIHSTFNQTETRTGRISSTEPNVQNIPVRTTLGSEIRKFFIARDGYTLIDADYSQIELRILAHIANDKTMIDGFMNGDDIHAITASQVFHCPMEQMTSTIRSRAKAINFGIVYGIGAYSLSQDINVSVSQAKDYIKAYLETYHGVADYMHNIIEKAEKDGFVSTLYGRKRDLADIHSTNKNIKAFAERVALNTPIQGTAADIIKLAMIKVHKRIKSEKLDARLILQVHDELIIEAPAMQADSVKAMLKEEMQNAANLLVPLIVDVNTGKNWYIAKG